MFFLSPPRLGPRLITLALAASALVYLGYHAAICLQAEDTNHLETPLALAVARQITESPRVLYGPFHGDRPLVLIHAPLYYRLAALAAAPAVYLGVDATDAALAAGRALALLGFAGSLAAAAGLAGIGLLGASRSRAMLWAALLIAAAPVFGSFSVTVRPDTLGIFFQTAGAFLALSAVGASPARNRLLAAYLLFGLAAVTKQHDIVIAGVTSLWLAWLWWRGSVRLRDLVLAHLAAIAVVAIYYGAEEWLTGGWMSYSVFRLPAAFRKVAPADWPHVVDTFIEVGKRSAGLILLVLATLPVLRRVSLDRNDLVLALMLLMETAATVVLCKGSTGAWYNYAMQAVLLLAILVSRALGRLSAIPDARWLWAGPVLASLALLALDVRLVRLASWHRGEERAAVAEILREPRIAFEHPEGLYFAGFPQHNRLHGRLDLAHDEWLYTAFEATRAAEPRSVWLRKALVDGRVNIVVVPQILGHTVDHLPGLVETLPELGYRPLVHHGRYRAWVRERDVATALAPDPRSSR